MNSRNKKILQFFLFLVISVFLFWLVYRDQNWQELKEVLSKDVDYTWIWVSCILGILSHISRALRWQLLTASMGHPIRFANSFMGIMIGYFANLAIPRMGEFTRCGVVSKYENVPFSKLLGTVVTERVIDLMILLALTLWVVISQFSRIGLFLERNKGIEEKVMSFIHSPWVWVAAFAVPLFLFLCWQLLKRTKFRDKLNGFLNGLKEGLLTVRHVKHLGLFVFYSLFIWLMFFLMLYFCFFCFEATSRLSLMVGLTIFVLGSFGMVAPVQGGIGAWHFMVISGLLLYLPDAPGMESVANTFALLTHGSMTLLYIVVGVLCVIGLPLYNAGKQKKV